MAEDAAFLQSLHEQLGQTLREFSAVKAALTTPRAEGRKRDGFISARTLPKQAVVGLGSPVPPIEPHNNKTAYHSDNSTTSGPLPKHALDTATRDRRTQQKSIPELLAATERLADAAQDVVRLARQCAAASSTPADKAQHSLGAARGGTQTSRKAVESSTARDSAASPATAPISSPRQHHRPASAARVPLLALADTNAPASEKPASSRVFRAKEQTLPQSWRQNPAPRTHAPQQTAMTAAPGHDSAASQQNAAPSAQPLRAAHTSRAGRSPHSLTSAVVLASSPKLSHRPGSALPQSARTPRQQHLLTAPGTRDLKAVAGLATDDAATSAPTQPSSASPQSMSAQPSQTAPEQRGEEPESTADLLQQLSSVRLPSGLGPEAADEPITPTSMHQLLHRIGEVQGLPRSSRPSADRAEHTAQPPQAAVPGGHTDSSPARSSRQSSSFKDRQPQHASSDHSQELQLSTRPAASGDLDLAYSVPLGQPMTPMSVHALVQRIESEVQGSSRPSRASGGSPPPRLAPEDMHQLLQRVDSQAAAGTRSARISAGSLQPPSAAPAESCKLESRHSSARHTQDSTLPADTSQPHLSAWPAASTEAMPASSPSPSARPTSPSLSDSPANHGPARSTSPPPQPHKAPDDTAKPLRSVDLAQGSGAVAPQAPQAESSSHQLLREISQELQLSEQGPNAGTPEAAAAGGTAAEPRESTEQLLQRINSALQGEPSGPAAEPAELGADPQDEGLQIKGVKLQLPSHTDRQLMAAAAATGLEETSQSSESAADSSNSSGMREPTTAGIRQPEGSSQPHSAHASSVKDGEPRHTSDNGSIEDIAAVASAGSAFSTRLAAEEPDSVQSRLERRGTYMSPLLLAVATQDAAEPEQRQHDAASQHSTAVPAAFRMASDEQEHSAGPQGAQQHPAPSSAASVDFEDGA